MTTGDIVLIPFPFAELTQIKARPAVVIGLTADRFQDTIVSAISSKIPDALSRNEFVIAPSVTNGLRVPSVVKVDRIVTTKASSIIAQLGRLEDEHKNRFVTLFRSLVEL